MQPRRSRAANPEGAGKKGAPRRWYKDGKLRESARPLLQELFLEQVELDHATGCWLWRGRLTDKGYGQTYLLGVVAPAHRVAYALFTDKISPDRHVCHACDRPACVNPDHLWLGTHKDNMQDMVTKGRHRARHNTGNDPRFTCPQGHAYTPENTVVYEGRRYCRACHKQYSLAYSRKEKTLPAKTHCGKGHEFTPENTYWYRGAQQCRACHREYSLAWWKRQQALAHLSEIS